MHILDFIMYFVTSWVLWKIIEVISGNEWTEELGGLIGVFIVVIYTIIYIIIFCIYPDWNWIDIFKGHYHMTWFKL